MCGAQILSAANLALNGGKVNADSRISSSQTLTNMYQPSEPMHSDTLKDHQTSTRESDTMDGATGFLENEQVYWDHPRHARKRPRLMEDVSQAGAEPTSPLFIII
jgi:hypothetical protein